MEVSDSPFAVLSAGLMARQLGERPGRYTREVSSRLPDIVRADSRRGGFHSGRAREFEGSLLVQHGQHHRVGRRHRPVSLVDQLVPVVGHEREADVTARQDYRPGGSGAKPRAPLRCPVHAVESRKARRDISRVDHRSMARTVDENVHRPPRPSQTPGRGQRIRRTTQEDHGWVVGGYPGRFANQRAVGPAATCGSGARAFGGSSSGSATPPARRIRSTQELEKLPAATAATYAASRAALARSRVSTSSAALCGTTTTPFRSPTTTSPGPTTMPPAQTG